MMSRAKKIIVVGAGAAGLACAISAARQQAEVCLIEKTAQLGGTVAHSLIHTIGGLYDDGGEYINAGLPVELAELLLQADAQTRKRQMGKLWTLSVDPDVYERVIVQWVADFSNIRLMPNTCLTQIHTTGERIAQVEVSTGESTDILPVDELVDATGSAAVVRLFDGSKVVEGDALAGLIFQVRGAAPGALKFPRNVGLQRNLKKAVEEGKLPAIFSRTWFDVGVHADEIYAKVNILATSYEPTAIPKMQHELLGFLKCQPDFSQSYIRRVGNLGIRDGGRIRGDYCLTLIDVQEGRRFSDAVGRCAWPIEYWDPRKGVTLEHLPPGHSYEIPLRSLKVTGTENLWAAGKCLSAEKLAQASARVAGTCWAMGDGLARAIAA